MNTQQKIAVAALVVTSAALGALTTKALQLRANIKSHDARAQAWDALRDKLKAEKEAGNVDLLFAFDEIVRIGNL